MEVWLKETCQASISISIQSVASIIGCHIRQNGLLSELQKIIEWTQHCQPGTYDSHLYTYYMATLKEHVHTIAVIFEMVNLHDTFIFFIHPPWFKNPNSFHAEISHFFQCFISLQWKYYCSMIYPFFLKSYNGTFGLSTKIVSYIIWYNVYHQVFDISLNLFI